MLLCVICYLSKSSERLKLALASPRDKLAALEGCRPSRSREGQDLPPMCQRLPRWPDGAPRHLFVPTEPRLDDEGGGRNDALKIQPSCNETAFQDCAGRGAEAGGTKGLLAVTRSVRCRNL